MKNIIQTTEEANASLATLKTNLLTLASLTINDLKDEVDTIRSNAYRCELSTMMSECENDDCIDGTINMDMDNLVIPREDIFLNILDERAAVLSGELDDIINKVRFARDCGSISVSTYNDKIIFEYKNFRSHNYQAVKNRYLKKNNKISSPYPFVTKSRAVFENQKEIIAKILKSGEVSISTITSLKNFGFIDGGIYPIINRLFYCISEAEDNYLHCGEDIRYGLAWIAKP